ncbi:MAG: Flp1 family type IVb pilin [Saccharofermentanales bacterium]|jgi:hypothetical protein|nr:Flp1 family type IVb pilin [Bacillota bacterium]NLB09150.1 hypothetical protein [Clostridiales bacterium]
MARIIKVLRKQQLQPKTRQNLRMLRRREEGFGTIEVVIIIAVMLAVAFLFRTQISRFAARLIDRVFSDSIIDSF